jgi:hypothetical protein
VAYRDILTWQLLGVTEVKTIEPSGSEPHSLGFGKEFMRACSKRHVHPWLGNDRVISNYTAAVAK